MEIPILLDDLIKYFHRSSASNVEIIRKTDDLIQEMKKPFWHRFFATSFSMILQFILWVAVVACFCAIVFMDKLKPFSVLSSIKDNLTTDELLSADLSKLTWTIRLLFLLMGLIFFWVAKLLSKERAMTKRIEDNIRSLSELMDLPRRDQSWIQKLATKYPIDLKSSESLTDKTAEGDDGHDDVLL